MHLSLQIARNLGCKVSDTLVDNFSNGETRVEIKDSCRGYDCFVVRPLPQSTNKIN
jgi:phosphoribosylpyrophosphate synthetase